MGVPRCKHSDRDVPEIVCGHPLPCPWHTVIIYREDPAAIKEAPNKQISIKQRCRLKRIAEILDE